MNKVEKFLHFYHIAKTSYQSTLNDYVQDQINEIFKTDLTQPVREIFYTDVQKFAILYQKQNNGGGSWFGQDYIKILKRYNRVFNHCYEWCSGPGFIGYSILEHGLCNNLFLSDKHLPALSDAECTKKYLPYEIQQNVIIQHTDNIADISDNYKFDLIVSNPPHYKTNQIDTPNDNDKRLGVDLDWLAHKNFYNNISKNLSDDAIILMQECSNGSNVEDFREMIISNGLKITDSFPCYSPNIYYIEIRPS